MKNLHEWKKIMLWLFLMLFLTLSLEIQAQCDQPINYAPIDQPYFPVRTVKLRFWILQNSGSTPNPGNIPYTTDAQAWLTSSLPYPLNRRIQCSYGVK
jgi:hypothetical protein